MACLFLLKLGRQKSKTTDMRPNDSLTFYFSTVEESLSAPGLKERSPGSTLMIFVAEKSKHELTRLMQGLEERDIPYFGAIFPKLIYDNEQLEHGFVINTLDRVEGIHVIKDLNTGHIEIPHYNLSRDEGHEVCAITFVDGLTSNISNYLSKLFSIFGNKMSYFGGGAGSLSLTQMPCVFSNQGIYQDAAVLAFQEVKSNLSVKHGWEKIHGPIVATKTEKNIVKELNWENAFDVYQNIVEQDSGMKFTGDNFFDIAKGYPFGMVKEYSESIVRDPLSLNENKELICVGEVPQNSVLNILKGKKETLLEAATSAAVAGINTDIQARRCLVIDCISRVLFLKNDFDQELSNVKRVINDKFSEITISGALTLGEISSYDGGYLEFFNKTMVVGVFE